MGLRYRPWTPAKPNRSPRRKYEAPIFGYDIEDKKAVGGQITVTCRGFGSIREAKVWASVKVKGFSFQLAIISLVSIGFLSFIIPYLGLPA
jgi:hypothetical protein